MSISLNGQKIVPTMFPDGTSQVWKLPEELLVAKRIEIVWEFENESELFHLLQITWLLAEASTMTLHMPFMPYGRQDKEVSNKTCFAREPFLWLLRQFKFDAITTIDAHSPAIGVKSIYPSEAIQEAIKSTNATQVCFPDVGARSRYDIKLSRIVLYKNRDPLTGAINGIKLLEATHKSSQWERVLIVDDICDGGRTFIEAAQLLHSIAPDAVVNLYVSHGIFSKGTQVLRDAGIGRIFTKNGEVL